jgi:hypothetical protein
MTKLKAVGLFLASPFIGLAYVVVLPWFCVYQAVSCSVELAHDETLTVASWIDKKMKEHESV